MIERHGRKSRSQQFERPGNRMQLTSGIVLCTGRSSKAYANVVFSTSIVSGDA